MQRGQKTVQTIFNEILSQNSTQPVEYYKANWLEPEVEDMIDKLTWEKLTEQFRLNRIPVSNDLDDWSIISRRKKM